MMDSATPSLAIRLHPSPVLVGLCVAAMLAGLGTFLGLFISGYEQRAFTALLQGMVLPTWIAVGALAFIAINRVCGSLWTVPIQRVMEGLTGGLWLSALAFIAILAVGAPYLYEWANATTATSHAEHAGFGRAEWMQSGRVWITGLVSLAAWAVLRARLVGLSLRSDAGEDISSRQVHASVALLIVLAPTFTLFVWDLLLSLHVGFASTMWGVYCFTGAIQTFLAVLVVAVVVLRQGTLEHVIKEHTLHDLGTWLMAWSIFCGYIGFAQYLVIYFANIEEEAAWFLPRLQHGYGTDYVTAASLRVLLPLVVLMSQSLRAHPGALVLTALAVLGGNWMDWHWIIVPAFSPNLHRPVWDPATLAIGLGFAGAVTLLALQFWRRHGPVACDDPRLLATINAEHLD
jgi:hypothetical protein